MPDKPFPIISAVNRGDVLRANLASSPDVRAGVADVIEEWGHASAGAAYNAGLKRVTTCDVVGFVHQDVYLPAGWIERVKGALAGLATEPWGLAGVWGVRADGLFAGRVWCSGGGQEHVGQSGGCEVESLDEIVLLLNLRYDWRFDERLPSYHLYATDIAMQVRSRGLKTYCLEAPVVHNSRCNPQPLDGGYRSAYRYMQRKWAADLPLRTCVVPVTWSGYPMYKQWARNEWRRARGRVRARPSGLDSAAIAMRLGYGCERVWGRA